MKAMDILRSNKQEIKERFAVRRIGIFGSFVRGEEKETSDIDILVEFEEPTFRNFMNLAFFLEDLNGWEGGSAHLRGHKPPHPPLCGARGGLG